MDDRISEADRIRKMNPADIYAHARLLSLALAAGKLNRLFHSDIYEGQERSLILGAFLGHEPCKIVVSENVKPSGVVFRDKLIRNIEMNEFLDGLLTWGYAITHRAALGIIKLLSKRLNNRNAASSNTKGLIKAMSDLIVDPDNNDKLQILNDSVSNRNFYIYGRRGRQNSNIASCIGLITGEMVRNKSCVGPMKAAAVYCTDESIKEAVRSEVYPFILGEYA